MRYGDQGAIPCEFGEGGLTYCSSFGGIDVVGDGDLRVRCLDGSYMNDVADENDGLTVIAKDIERASRRMAWMNHSLDPRQDFLTAMKCYELAADEPSEMVRCY
jgi:hypothetical protein